MINMIVEEPCMLPKVRPTRRFIYNQCLVWSSSFSFWFYLQIFFFKGKLSNIYNSLRCFPTTSTQRTWGFVCFLPNAFHNGNKSCWLLVMFPLPIFVDLSVFNLAIIGDIPTGGLSCLPTHLKDHFCFFSNTIYFFSIGYFSLTSPALIFCPAQ